MTTQGREGSSSESPQREARLSRTQLAPSQGAFLMGPLEVLPNHLSSLHGGDQVLTTSMKSTETSKLGFFLTFLMTQDCTSCPLHSTIKLGEVTLASW